MALRDRLRRLERKAVGPVVVIPQNDGPPKRFPKSDLAPAFLDALDRMLGKRGLRHEPEPANAAEHPLSTAARNSSDSHWREGLYVGDRPEEHIPDLSE